MCADSDPVKDDAEPVQQWPLSCVTDCSIQMLAKRKQGPVLPTLVVTLNDKERKRRSSRAGSLISASRESGASSLWFRIPPDDHHPSLHDWAHFIQSKKAAVGEEDSPITPTSVTFSPRSKDAPDYFNRPESNPANRSLHHKSSTATYSTSANRPAAFSSNSPSLRSKRSDISSPSSTIATQTSNYHIPGQHYTTVLPTDLPSPVNTTGDFPMDNMEGWITKARSSTVSSPTHPRESMSPRAQHASMISSSSPPGPRETLLDRAFQMRSISAAAQRTPGEEKLSSVARFDALMREADEKRKQKEAIEREEQMAMRSAFEDDDSSDVESDSDTDDTDSDVDPMTTKGGHGDRSMMSDSTHRALQYIASRPGPSSRPAMSRNNLSFHASTATTASLTREPPERPHTAHEKGRRDLSQRAQSAHYLPSFPSAELSGTAAGLTGDTAGLRPSGDKVQSNSNKRLSFTEFTKRLSSTSSLLLVQTNASGNSSRRNSEIEPTTVPRTSLRPAGATGPTPRERERLRDEAQKRCSWRGGGGIVGGEGGFF
jgi:hypothetical protein